MSESFQTPTENKFPIEGEKINKYVYAKKTYNQIEELLLLNQVSV
jgi:hypothetical protein